MVTCAIWVECPLWNPNWLNLHYLPPAEGKMCTWLDSRAASSAGRGDGTGVNRSNNQGVHCIFRENVSDINPTLYNTHILYFIRESDLGQKGPGFDTPHGRTVICFLV